MIYTVQCTYSTVKISEFKLANKTLSPRYTCWHSNIGIASVFPWPWQDANLQFPDPKSGALSIRPQGRYIFSQASKSVPGLEPAIPRSEVLWLNQKTTGKYIGILLVEPRYCKWLSKISSWPWKDSNLQSSDPKSGALSTRPQGRYIIGKEHLTIYWHFTSQT